MSWEIPLPSFFIIICVDAGHKSMGRRQTAVLRHAPRRAPQNSRLPPALGPASRIASLISLLFLLHKLKAIEDWPDEITKLKNSNSKSQAIENPSHFWGDGPEIGPQMSYRALEPRPDSSRTRRIQPRQRESQIRAISGSIGPFFGPKN